MSRFSRLLWIAVVLVATASFGNAKAAEAIPSAEQVRFFESEVRPVLVEHCAKCHGPNKPKAGLRLDSRTAVLTGGDTGPAVVLGKPGESLLIEAVEYKGPEMPPSGKLPKEKVAALSKWVEMGAPWPGGEESAPAPVRRGPMQITEKDRQHWAFRPIVAPRLPPASAGSPENPIDTLLTARLKANGLLPNPAAAPRELVRRAYYDLTGLPPTPEEVEAFAADPSPNAYETLVDRLLDSPHYGEKWGRHWLDLVRYAETNSYERDNPKPNAWRYRDYVIRALNEDKPFDRFIREQLAGDELPDRDNDAMIATGYYRLGIWDDEPSDREQARYDSLDDIVATTGQVFLGLTVDCARCHDHKLDPIPQKDYYRLLAFFQNIQPFRNGGPTDEVVLDAGADQRKVYDEAVRERDRKRNEIQGDLTEIEHEFLAQQTAKAGTVRETDIDGLRFRFYRDTWDRLPDFDGLKPEETGTLASGLFDLAPRSRDTAFGFVFEGTLIVPTEGTYRFFLDSDDGSRLLVDGHVVATHDGIHGLGAGKNASVHLAKGRVPIRLDYFQGGHGLGLRVAWSGPGVPLRTLSARDAKEDAPAGSLAELIREAGAAVLGPERFERYKRLRHELERLNDQQVPAEKALCVSEMGAQAPETFVLMRGNPHVPGDKVEPGFLQVVTTANPVIPTADPSAKTSGRRRVLADWVASPDNPLTARVLANRLWQHHFGRGIVRSPNNFGIQGDKPTHPELLDYLAAELFRGGWRLKPLHRLIMTSNAYKMSSRARPEALTKDPTNDLFWRFDMRRLTGEEIRDSVLAVTGTLSPKMYGPGVFVEIPPEVLAGQSIPGKGWGKSSAEDQARRSIYIHVKRSLLAPILESFDLAETDRSTPVRFSTTQPTQALGMLNGAFLNEQAARLAARLHREAGEELRGQVARALALVTERRPTDSEIRRGLDLIESLRTQPGTSPEAALQTFCLVALNLNEFVYLD
ncbi:MAG: DUF1549 domain-containing protein [Isosphaeraceae bacterium]|nr:DUF1549 domain-containing protein [Isosphaeraceae bacterium]